MAGSDTSDDWGTSEIVRALRRIESKVDGLHDKFVPRELYRSELRNLSGRIDAVGLEVTDLRADYTRREKARADEARNTWRWGVGIVATGLVALATLTLQLLTLA